MTCVCIINLKIEKDDNLWPIYIDDGDLEDAILNLTINAMHAMPGSGVLTVTTKNTHLDANDAKVLGVNAGDYVTLCLQDTGSGMNEQTVEKIFDPFFTTKGEKGTGLGLSQVYGFVQRSKGAIRVVSEMDVGSGFYLYFPRYDIGNEMDEQRAEKETDRLSGSETILVVDDERALRSLTEEVLSMNGYRVLTAKDAEDALDVLESNKVDLMLSDVIMPGLNGYQLARKVMESYPHVRIQMVSGYNDADKNIEVIRKLQLYQLQKPFNTRELLLRIRELLDAKVNDALIS